MKSFLLARHHLIATRTEIEQRMGENECADRIVDVHITRLRKKLGDYAGIIVNRSGFGYYLNIDAKDDLTM